MNALTTPPDRAMRLPPDIHGASDYERLAPDHLPNDCFQYLAGGSGEETSLSANRQAFSRWGILPRLLKDVRGGHTRTTLLGHRREHPLMLAPVAFQTLAHPHGETETARGAEATDTLMTVSTLSAFSLEAVSAASSGGKWFQLYFQPSREVTADLVRRAVRAGYEALVVTLDAPIQQPGRRALRAGFVRPASVQAASLANYAAPAQMSLSPAQSVILDGMMRDAPTMDDLMWLLKMSPLPVIVKGVMRPDDALGLRMSGVDGVIVSNHGGRGLDGVPAALDCLPGIRKAVGPDYPVLFDSGVRSGADAFKAIALGANAVMIGRLQIYALAVGGALGVAHMLKLMREELEMCMALAGCRTLGDITADLLTEVPRC